MAEFSTTALLVPDSLPQGMELVMRVAPMPADANGNGDIFGGWIMAQVDLSGSALPVRISRGRVATIAVNEFVFRSAVSVGDLLSIYARIVRVGNTSMTVHVEVWAERPCPRRSWAMARNPLSARNRICPSQASAFSGQPWEKVTAGPEPQSL